MMRHQGKKTPRPLIGAARELRQDANFAEDALWHELRGRRFLGIKFRRQHQIGDYIVDFYCRWFGLVIEVDGVSHDLEEARKADEARTRYLESLGLSVLRFDNEIVLHDMVAVADKIWRTVRVLKERTPPAV